jgi:hypothetical protein
MGAWQPASESLSRFCYRFVSVIIAGKGDHGGASASRARPIAHNLVLLKSINSMKSDEVSDLDWHRDICFL